MAYPGEHEHIEYLKYVEEMAAKGEQALSKEEWRKMRNQQQSMMPGTNKPMKTALSEY